MLRTTTSHMIALCAAADGAREFLFGSTTTLDGAAPPPWLLMVPAGKIKTNDRRTFDNSDPAAVIAASKDQLPIHIDFDHGTQTRGDSRAACWITELAAQGPNGEPGIWGKTDWTPPGRQALADKVYRFFSPTMAIVKGVVTKIVGGGLVNNPAIDELPALASTNQENALTLEELLAKLRKALGLPDTATADDITAAITALSQNNTAAAASQQLLATASGITLAAGAQLNTDQVTAICSKLKAPATGDATTVATLSAKVEDLTTRLNTALLSQDAKTAEDIVNQGVKDGRIAPAVKDEMLAICKKDVPAFQAMLTKAPVILKDGKTVNGQVADGELNADELAICAMGGITPDAFKKTKAAMAKQENV